MGKKTEFLFMSEQDCIDAGVLDIPKSIDNSEEVFKLLAMGDYLMGGYHHDNHGLYLMFPESSPFPNMPLAGPDKRFVAMPAYLGGRFNLCGVKWYGSNAENKNKISSYCHIKRQRHRRASVLYECKPHLLCENRSDSCSRLQIPGKERSSGPDMHWLRRYR